MKSLIENVCGSLGRILIFIYLCCFLMVFQTMWYYFAERMQDWLPRRQCGCVAHDLIFVCIWIRTCLFVWMLICIIHRRLKALVLGVGIWWVFFRMSREWSTGVAGYYSGDRGAVCWAYWDEGRWYSRISGQEILQAAMSSRSTGCPTDWPHCQ